MAEHEHPQAADIPNAAPEKKESSKKIGTLESVVNETGSLLKNLGGAALAVSMPLALGYVAPDMLRDAAVVTTAFSAGKMYENYKAGRKTRISDVVKESAVGTLLTPPIHYGYDLMNKIENPLLKAAAYLGPYTLGVIPLYLAVDHIVKKGFKGVYPEGIKPHLKNVIKDNYKYLAAAGLLNLFLTPAYLQVPVALGLGFLFKLIAGRGKNKEEVPESEKRDKTQYYAAASGALYKLGSSIFNLPYNIGRAISSYSLPSPKPRELKPEANPAGTEVPAPAQ